MKLILSALVLNGIALALAAVNFAAAPAVPDLKSEIQRERNVVKLRQTALHLQEGARHTTAGLRLSLISLSLLVAGSAGMLGVHLLKTAADARTASEPEAQQQ